MKSTFRYSLVSTICTPLTNEWMVLTQHLNNCFLIYKHSLGQTIQNGHNFFVQMKINENEFFVVSSKAHNFF